MCQGSSRFIGHGLVPGLQYTKLANKLHRSNTCLNNQIPACGGVSALLLRHQVVTKVIFLVHNFVCQPDKICFRWFISTQNHAGLSSDLTMQVYSRWTPMIALLRLKKVYSEVMTGSRACISSTFPQSSFAAKCPTVLPLAPPFPCSATWWLAAFPGCTTSPVENQRYRE